MLETGERSGSLAPGSPAAVKALDLIDIGRISGFYGVRGWVRIYSFTRPIEKILEYPNWLVGQTDSLSTVRVLEGRRHGKGLIARLQGIDSRDAAQPLLDARIAITRSQLPTLPEGEYYWNDLNGLSVVNQQGVELGQVEGMLETGVHDVMQVAGEHACLIPFVPEVFIKSVDLQQGLIRVDWDADY